VGFRRLAEVIKEHKEDFGGSYPGKTTLQAWYKDWLEEQ